jgi:hypothetical protein
MVPILCRIDTVPLLEEFLLLDGMHRAKAAGATGLFVVAAMARPTRVTQGKRFFTL